MGIIEKRISMGHARALINIPESKQLNIYKTILEKDLSVRKVEELAKEDDVPKLFRPAKVILPVEFQKILSGGMFPAIGIFSDIERFGSHTIMEFTGYDVSNPDLTVDEVRKKAQPIKNLSKMLPLFKSLITYAAIFDAEFAKEYDITIQKESRR
jgi:ParB-like chromosome segregation protein Spo0J